MTQPLDLLEQRLSDRGCHPIRKGDGLEARCPAHDDHTPSLSAAVGRDRDIVIHCHTGCQPNAILEALDLRWQDFGEGKPRANGLGEILATYDYHDADGELLFQVVRYIPKTFRQRRPDGRGGWVWNLRGVTPVLYNLPAVAAQVAAGGEVWIAEGEKDADALGRAGVVATTAPQGAGKFTAEMAQTLEGASLVNICADDDEAGKGHAAEIAGHLATLSIPAKLWLPAQGKDVADHLAAGRPLAELQRLDIEPTKPPAFPLEQFLIDWPAFWEQDAGDAEWILEPLFAKGRSHAVYASAKTGKSWVVLAACAALATGAAFLHRPVGEPIDVLYVDYEMTAEDLMDRLFDFGYGPDDDLSRLHYALLPSIDALDTPEGGQQILDSAKAVGAEFVIFDTTSRAVGGEENEADTFRAFYRCTGLPLKQAGIGYMRLDHAGHSGDHQRGSSAKNDDVDVVVRLENVEPHGKKWHATHRRMSWYPEQTVLDVNEAEGTYRFSTTDRGYPEGTNECLADIESLGLPVDIGVNAAQKALREAGHGRKRAVISAAIRFRRESADDPLEAF